MNSPSSSIARMPAPQLDPRAMERTITDADVALWWYTLPVSGQQEKRPLNYTQYQESLNQFINAFFGYFYHMVEFHLECLDCSVSVSREEDKDAHANHTLSIDTKRHGTVTQMWEPLLYEFKSTLIRQGRKHQAFMIQLMTEYLVMPGIMKSDHPIIQNSRIEDNLRLVIKLDYKIRELARECLVKDLLGLNDFDLVDPDEITVLLSLSDLGNVPAPVNLKKSVRCYAFRAK